MRLSAPVALWAVVIPVSPASEIVCQLAIGTVPGWLIWCRISVLAAVLAVGALEQRARILVPFCAVYLFLLLLTAPLEILASSGRYQAFMSREGFVRGTIVVHSIWLALLVPVVFWLRRRPDQFYFRIGDLTARLQPLWTVGTARLPRWSTIAPLFALVSAVVAWLFVSILGEAAPKPWWAVPLLGAAPRVQPHRRAAVSDSSRTAQVCTCDY